MHHGLMRQLLPVGISIGLLGLIAGCGGSSDEVDVAGAEPSAPLAIVYPPSQATTDSNLVEVKGIGLRNEAGLSVAVLTDHWYPQAGTLHVSGNNSWSYAPVYLEGQGAFNKHTIKVTVTHTDGRTETATATGVVRGN